MHSTIQLHRVLTHSSISVLHISLVVRQNLTSAAIVPLYHEVICSNSVQLERNNLVMGLHLILSDVARQVEMNGLFTLTGWRLVNATSPDDEYRDLNT